MSVAVAVNTTIPPEFSEIAAICTATEVEIGGRQMFGIADARDLHAGLKVKRDYTTWMKDRIDRFGFVEGEDFEVFTKSGENPLGGRPAKEYTLSLDMAKELSMVENNEQGRLARRYFIWTEKQLHSGAPALSDDRMYRMLRDFSHWRADQTRELAEMKEQINAVVEVVKPPVPGTYQLVGESPGNILKAEGVTDQLRGLALWFGNLLENAGIKPVGKANKARLFPRDQAAAFLKNGGMTTVRRHIAEKKGQGALAIPGMNKRRMKKRNAQGRGVIGMGDEAVTFQAGMTVCPGEEALLVLSQDGLHFGIGTRTMTSYDVTKTTRFGPPQGAMGMLPVFIVVGRVLDRQPMP